MLAKPIGNRVVLGRRRVDNPVAYPPSADGSVLTALGALLGIVACTSPGLAQVQVGPQIRIDNGGMAAANETSIASSNYNPDEIVAAWNDWRESPPPPEEEIIRIGVGISMNGGMEWTNSLLVPPPPMPPFQRIR